MRWEYRVHHVYPPGSGSHVQSLEVLNAFGEERWEVAATLSVDRDGRVALLLKRSKG